MKNKKILYGIGTLTVTVVASASTISCGSEQASRIMTHDSNVIEDWLNTHQGYEGYIKSNDKGGSIDMPIFEAGAESTLGNIFEGSTKDEVFTIDFKNKNNQMLTISELKEHFLDINQKIIGIRASDPITQHMVFYKHSHKNLTVKIKKLKKSDNSDTHSFLNNVADQYNFKKPGVPGIFHEFNGQALIETRLLKKTDTTEFVDDNHQKVFLDNRYAWSGYMKNRFFDPTGTKNYTSAIDVRKVWDDSWEKNKTNLINTIYIDYKKHVSKLMTISIEGGTLIQTKRGVVDKVIFQNAKSVKYKVTTIKNMIPIGDTVTVASAADNKTLKDLLVIQVGKPKTGTLQRWLRFTLDGPKRLSSTLSLAAAALPQLQMMIKNIEIFSDEWTKQRNKLKKSIGSEDWIDNNDEKLNIFRDIDDNLINIMIKSLEDNHFNFAMLKDLEDVLTGTHKTDIFNSINGRTSKFKNKSWENLDSLWVANTYERDQFMVVELIFLLKYISIPWSTLK